MTYNETENLNMRFELRQEPTTIKYFQNFNNLVNVLLDAYKRLTEQNLQHYGQADPHSCFFVFQLCTWMAAPHDRHLVFQGEAWKRCVGFAVLQHHIEVALLMLQLATRQRQFGGLLAFFVVHLHLLTEALWGRVIDKVHRVVVHAWHCEVPLHLLIIREITGIVGRDELGLRLSPRQGDLHYGQCWGNTRRRNRGLKCANINH